MGHGHSQQYPPSREVLTTYGPIVGRRLIHEGDKQVCISNHQSKITLQVDAFQGVPYAKPPVGPLRFQVVTHHSTVILILETTTT